MPWLYNYDESMVVCREDRTDIGRDDCAHFTSDNVDRAANRLLSAHADSWTPCPCGCSTLIATPHGADAVPPEVTEHPCWQCRNFFPLGAVSHFVNARGNTVSMCEPCISEVSATCDDCRERFHENTMESILCDGDVRLVCGSCSGEYHQCPHCDTYWHEDMGQTCCEWDEDTNTVQGCECRECSRTLERSSIKAYSYKPSPDFRSLPGEQVVRKRVNRYGEEISYDATPYLGFELEVEVANNRNRTAAEFQRAVGNVAYLKSDGSLNNGFEIVTHPMTLGYAMAQFPWRVIREFRRSGKIVPESTCGLHVHVSRAAFNPGGSHEYRWLLFWHRNQQIMRILARRDSTYAEYNADHRNAFKDLVKGRYGHQERYSAINTINEHTLEVRVFAATLYVNRLKAALQLVESTVEYTRHLAASKVLADGGFAWQEYVSWLQANNRHGRYADLLEQFRQLLSTVSVPDRRTERLFVGHEPTGEFDRWGDRVTRAAYRSMVVQEKVSN